MIKKMSNILYNFLYKFVKILKLNGVKIDKCLAISKHLLFD